jgi:hypothetical protein
MKLRSAKISLDLRVNDSARIPEIPQNHGNGSHYGRAREHIVRSIRFLASIPQNLNLPVANP